MISTRTQDELLNVLGSPNRKDPVVWILGSGLTIARGSSDGMVFPSRGVPGTAQMIDLVREALAGERPDLPSELDKSLEELRDNPVKTYQAAFEFASRHLEETVLDRVVRMAVIGAYDVNDSDSRESFESGDYNRCRQAIRDVSRWAIRPGLEHFGHIAATNRATLGRTILTTNFDPLIEVSLYRAQGNPVTTIMDGDGALGHTHTDQAHVVHLHGYWFGSRFLHTRAQLERDRPKLRGSLRQLLERSDVCVVGYGGWDDIFMRALIDVVGSMPYQLRVHWCFFEKDEEVIESHFSDRLDQFSDAIEDRRFFAYRGIDADRLFPALHQFLANRPIRPSPEAARSLTVERQMDDLQAENARLTAEVDALKRAQRVIEISQTLSSLSDDVKATREFLGAAGDEPLSVRAQLMTIINEMRTNQSAQQEAAKTIIERLDDITQNTMSLTATEEKVEFSVNAILKLAKGLSWRSWLLVILVLSAIATYCVFRFMP